MLHVLEFRFTRDRDETHKSIIFVVLEAFPTRVRVVALARKLAQKIIPLGFKAGVVFQSFKEPVWYCSGD